MGYTINSNRHFPVKALITNYSINIEAWELSEKMYLKSKESGAGD